MFVSQLMIGWFSTTHQTMPSNLLRGEVCTRACIPLPRCPTGALRGHRQQENMIFNCFYPPRSLLMSANIIYNQVTTGRGGNPGESIGFILRCDRIIYILIVAYKSTVATVHALVRRMTISALCRIIDSDNIGFIEIAH